jgi:hypothetical protein
MNTGILDVLGDIHTVPWTDYSATSTIVGWSSLTVKTIFYKKIGNIVFVSFSLSGPSDSTAVNFTLPYTSKNTANLRYYGAMGETTDAGTTRTSPGSYYLEANSNRVDCFVNMASAAWTNSGTKRAYGQFWYEAA